MNKNYFLSLVAILVCSAFSFANSTIGDPTKAVVLNCFDVPELTVLQPTCGSPDTGAITVDSPLGDNFLYSIDGITYQESPFFDSLPPGVYHVSYKDISGCVSETDTVPINDAVPHATIGLTTDTIPNQVICINTAIAPIVFTIGGTATQAVITGLPVGVTAVLSDGAYTISGVPVASGQYAFTVITDGACPATFNGNIFVKLNVAIVWISSSGAKNQTLCAGIPIVPIKYIVANGATGAMASGLPSGVTSTFLNGVYTLSGTPSVSGTTGFTVATVGGCSVASSAGSITVNPIIALGLHCDNSVTNSQSVHFIWDYQNEITSCNYSYTLNGGSPVSGVIVGESTFTISDVPVGQTVVFTITAVPGMPCFVPQSATCTSMLGNEGFDSDAFRYFPNPVRDLLHIEAKEQIEMVTVYDMLGQKVSEIHNSGSLANLGVSMLQKGVYVVVVASDRRQKTIRMIKE